MLNNLVTQPTLQAAVQRYLQDTLGVAPKVRRWADGGKVPYFLQDAFDLFELELFDRRFLLAVDRNADKLPPAGLRGQLDKLTEAAGRRVIYVADALASYERKRLIDQKVPFIVPGNQLYLPDLAIDMREYFRQRPAAAGAALSPATQAMLIKALLRLPWQTEWQPTGMVADLGYTAMTLSRAVRELTAAGIATVHNEGRVRTLKMVRPPAETWEHAKPLLRSPVKRRVWVHSVPRLKPPRVRWAGLSALARYSMIAEPRWPIYALNPAQWKAETKAGMEILPEQQPDACELQLWHYSPALVPGVETVDPLSLTLSLQDDVDDRVQIALGELKEHFPW